MNQLYVSNDTTKSDIWIILLSKLMMNKGIYEKKEVWLMKTFDKDTTFCEILVFIIIRGILYIFSKNNECCFSIQEHIALIT